MKKPLLSIIIVNWNTSTITLNCISSINKYLSKITPEIIVVDNGSTDESVSLISKQYPNIKIIQNSTNLGFAKANNQGAAKSCGNYLLFINSDMVLLDNSIIKMLNFLIKNNNIGIIGPKFLNPDLTPQASVFPPQTPLNAIKEFWFKQTNSYTKYTPPSLSPQSVWAVSGGCILMSKKIFDRIGGWNEKYFFYYEDLDLCQKIRGLNLRIIYYPMARVVHHHGQSGQKLADSSNQWKRLIPSSKLYFGNFQHYLIFSILWLSQKIRLR